LLGPSAQASSYRSPIVQSSDQQPAPPKTTARNTAVDALALGQPVDRELSGGQKHTYQLTLANGQYACLIVEQRGTIRILDNGVLQPGNFLDLQSVTNFDGQEQGLLGIAFHPDFSTNHKFYVNYTMDDAGLESIISEFQTLSTDPNTADPNSERVLLLVHQPFPNHKGGQLVFGPDGFLYIGLGDGGSGGDPGHRAQNPSELLGKMLRIDVNVPDDNPSGYQVPSDNPFVAGVPTGVRPEIWSFGLRNPWRYSFDRSTGDLWGGEVGQDLWEMIYKIEKGGNYGWSVMEGTHPFRPERKKGPTKILEPVVEHSHTDFRSITGGFVYRGKRLPELVGYYVYADYVSGKIWGLKYDEKAKKVVANRPIAGPPGFNIPCMSIGADEGSEMYLGDSFGQLWWFEKK
jgi:quinoprotein glucose dehydrogenase